VATYGFDEQSVKRIGKTVRLSEKFPQKVSLGGPDRSGANPGVRIMLGQRTATSSWAKFSSAVISVYGGEPNTNGVPTNSVGTVAAWNVIVDVDANTATRWVTLSNNGFAWYAIAAECL